MALQLPTLKLPDGSIATQSIALARYDEDEWFLHNFNLAGPHINFRFAAKKAGLYPRDNDEEALKIDEARLSCFEGQFSSCIPGCV